VIAYGCFEIRAKVAPSVTTNAWWFSGGAVNSAGETFKNEIDIFELQSGSGGRENNYGMCLHVFSEHGKEEHWRNGADWKAPFHLSDDFHTFSLVWSPDWLRYYIDGHCVRTAQNTAWHVPLRMIFDLEIMDWLPFPKDAEFPVTFRIDYVRAWTRPEWVADPTLKPLVNPTQETPISRKVREFVQ
jgi:beta-glucanase (GH16 family)